MFRNWAQPVTHPLWAVTSIVLHRLMRLSGYRLLGHATHCAWQKAVV